VGNQEKATYQKRIKRVNVVKKTKHPKSSKIVNRGLEKLVMLNVAFPFVNGTIKKKLVLTRNCKRMG
jgi:hypothetical protein